LQGFSFAAIYELFSQPYPIIQQFALNVVEYLIIHNTDDSIHEKFRASSGVQFLVEILNVRIIKIKIKFKII
jgi:hypothetical protein